MNNSINGLDKSQRFSKLDGIRGLLSIVVALNHSFLVIAIPGFANVWGQNILQFTNIQSKLQQIFMLLGNGGAAVTLFFVMSGFVLGISLKKTELNFVSTINLYIKRIVRLYPVYLLILILTALYMRTIYYHKIFTYAADWYHWWMQFEMTTKEFFYNLLFIHAYTGGVTWTLRVILIASFIFPLFIAINRKTNWLGDLIITGILVYISFNILNITGFRDLRYLYMFYAGLSLTKFSDFFSKISKRTILIMIPIMIFLLTDFRYLTDEYIGGVGEAVVSWFLIGILIYNQTSIFNFLENKILQYYGKISYSLYLIHFSVLYLIARFMFENIKIPFNQYYLLTHLSLFVLSLLVATFISHLVYCCVEKPSAILSKKLQFPNKA